MGESQDGRVTLAPNGHGRSGSLDDMGARTSPTPPPPPSVIPRSVSLSIGPDGDFQFFLRTLYRKSLIEIDFRRNISLLYSSNRSHLIYIDRYNSFVFPYFQIFYKKQKKKREKHCKRYVFDRDVKNSSTKSSRRMGESNLHRPLKVFMLPGSVDIAFVINHDEFVVINYAFRSISFPISETVPLSIFFTPSYRSLFQPSTAFVFSTISLFLANANNQGLSFTHYESIDSPFSPRRCLNKLTRKIIFFVSSFLLLFIS